MNKDQEHNCCNNQHEHDHEECNCNSENGHCDCGHDHDHEEYEKLHLTLEDDTELECYILGTFEVEDKSYIALLPEDQEDVLLYNYIEVGEEEIKLNNIEDDDEFDIVSKAFYELFGDEDE